MPKAKRAFLQPESSSHSEISWGDAKRRKTGHSTETSMEPASQRTNGTKNEIPEKGPSSLGSRIARYHLRSSSSRKDSTVMDARQQPVGQDHSSLEGEASNGEEGIFDMKGDQNNISISPLCHYCRYMIDNWSKWIDDEDFRYPHYENHFQLIDSAKNGCSLCYQFCRNYLEGEPAVLWFREGNVAGVWVRHAIMGRPGTHIVLALGIKISGPDSDKWHEILVDMTPAVPLGEQVQLLMPLN
jgi:hypothetical protein